jgi:putative transposase
VIRHAIKKRKIFPTDDSVKKVVWLAIQAASQKWTMPLRDWRMAMSRFIIEFGGRLAGHFYKKAFTQNRVQGLLLISAACSCELMLMEFLLRLMATPLQ